MIPSTYVIGNQNRLRIQKNPSYLGQVRLRAKPVYEVDDNNVTKRMIMIDGETHSLTDWSKLSGINYFTLAKRVSNGVEPQFLLKPTRKKSNAPLPEYKVSGALTYLIEKVWYCLFERPTDCVEWPFSRSGYGRVLYHDRTEYVHRLAYLFAGYSIPNGHVIRHKCDNPPCFNVCHLETGTHSDNMCDSLQRGSRMLNKIVKGLAF